MEDVFQFNFLAFFLAFMAGIFYVYTHAPPTKVIVQFPTPYNAGKTVYRDNANTCFIFNAHRTPGECPKDAKPQPVDT